MLAIFSGLFNASFLGNNSPITNVTYVIVSTTTTLAIISEYSISSPI